MSRIICIFFLLKFHLSLAQIYDLKFDHITVDDGLSQNQGQCSFEDSRGYMWFGTNAGLNRYDGSKFKIYRPDVHDESSISSLWASKCLEDAFGNLWVATGFGLNKYDYKSDGFTRYFQGVGPHSIPDNFITNIFIDSRGRFWVSTGHGLARYNYSTDDFRTYFLDKGETLGFDSYVHDIEEDAEGNIILAMGSGVIVILDPESGNYQTIPYLDDHIRNQQFHSLLMDSKDVLWISAYTQGFFSIDFKRDLKVVRSHAEPRAQPHVKDVIIRCMFEDKWSNLWLGSDGHGLFVLDSSKTKIYNYTSNPTDPSTLSTNNGIFDIYQSSSGIIWVAQTNAGINFFDPNANNFGTIQHAPNNENSLNENAILSFLEDSKGRVWVGTDKGGLDEFVISENRFIHHKLYDADRKLLNSSVVKSLAEDSDGNLLIGTWNQGLIVYNVDSKIAMQYVNDHNDSTSIIHNDVWDIEVDNAGGIWLGTLKGGLDKFIPQENRFDHFGPRSGKKNRLNDEDVRTMFQDREGVIWIGTISHGINKFDPVTGEIEYIQQDSTNANSLCNNDVRTIYQDDKGIMWFGTEGGGLDRYNPENKQFHHFSTKDGLPSDLIHGILQDDSGNYWISTGNGLSYLNWNTQIFRNFDKLDGLQGNDFQYSASMKSKDGVLFFGGTNGFNYFDPSTIKDNENLPKVMITKLSVGYKEVVLGDETGILSMPIEESESIFLNYEQSVISLGFSALNFTHSEKNRYAYKMKGFDEEWYYSGKNQTATYTNLDPGEYTFQVKGSNNDNKWNDVPTELRITIIPPFWKNKMVQVLVFLVMIFAFIALWRWRVTRLEEQKSLLKQEVIKRTEELIIKNERIALQAEELHTYNDNLELLVKKRTHQLETRNIQLAEYAFMNAHNLRAPIANLKGLIYLLDRARAQSEKDELLIRIGPQVEIVDEVLININKLLEEDSDDVKENSSTL